MLVCPGAVSLAHFSLCPPSPWLYSALWDFQMCIHSQASPGHTVSCLLDISTLSVCPELNSLFLLFSRQLTALRSSWCSWKSSFHSPHIHQQVLLIPSSARTPHSTTSHLLCSPLRSSSSSGLDSASQWKMTLGTWEESSASLASERPSASHCSAHY